MYFLDELFDLYKESNSISGNFQSKVPSEKSKISFGDVIEIFTGNSMYVAVYLDQNQAILMSEYWEFATDTDIVVSFHHPLGDKWMIEIDSRLHFSGEETMQYYSSLPEEITKVLQDTLDGKQIPPEYSGPMVPLNPKDPRQKFKKGELKKNLKFNKHLFIEKEEK